VRDGELGAIEEATLTLRFSQWPRRWQADAADWLRGPAEGGFTREVGSHFIFLAQRLFGSSHIGEINLRRAAGGTETSVRGTLKLGQITLRLDAAVEGDEDDYNRFEVRGSKGAAAITDWYRLDYGGAVSDRTSPNSTQLDELARLITTGTSASLATFEEAASVVETVEALLAAKPAAPPAH